MPSSPPDYRNCSKEAFDAVADMTVAQSTKAKSASKAGNGNTKTKSKTQMHRRSRTGCYTCRLRRKKCDEGTPMCTACKHLGLQCEYRRPIWWSNNDARRKQKEDIKRIIKRKKLAEKTSSSVQTSVSPPPGLSHSAATSTTYSDPMDRTRSASIDSQFSGGFNFNSPPNETGCTVYNTQLHPDYVLSGYLPYEVDVKTERQMFVNDVPTLRESHVATFSTYETPPPPGTVLPSGRFEIGWTDHVRQERRESMAEEALNVNFFDFAHGSHNGSRQFRIELEESDQLLLDHFIQYVLPIIFPILESNQHGSVGSDLILPALQSNGVFLNCCLSIAAQHLKTHAAVPGKDIDEDIMRHRYATIFSLCESLKRDENHQQILEATLGLIFFQCVVGRFDDDGLLDIAWHQHFQAAISLVQKLDLPRLVSEPAGQIGPTPFNMTLTSWIDILGATMQGASPTFAHTYREKHLSPVNSQLGLRELMGCEDRVMYLISEIACLDSLKKEGMDDYTLCQHVSALGEQLTLTEVGDTGPRMPYNASGTLSPKQLCKNITSAFRIAARIYLCSLIPGFSPSQPSPRALIEKLTNILQFIPSGSHGYDRSLVWVYLVAGSVSLPGSSIRPFFEDRVAQLGHDATCGAFGRMVTVVQEVWIQAGSLAQAASPGSCSSEVMQPYVNWRHVMQAKGWDFLLI
ncbi:PRO1 protein [Metarhizium album ARSEF 1941]|uniref:PRO1 protein n=1 Tax=Metarhizium album (strain ARSEF 1941) TaxID=1081103 RepID=A0A0B2WK47_METAS|nr:PRO1 protein [Metarhizium album ARSEF 1941]KHN96431.1 PRO1 protein [Metarhizium album ARSEF 1941]